MCHCGKLEAFNDCCGIYINGEGVAPTAESLMRSRYAAFVEKKFDYLLNTTDPQIRSEIDHQGNQLWAESVIFKKLEILNSSEDRNKATVEFVATFLDLKTNEVLRHHEISKFRQQSGIWYYRDGKIISA